MNLELVEVPQMPKRAKRFFAALGQELGQSLEPYSGTCENIILWGPGGAYQQELLKLHRGKGGMVFMLDIGYWHRKQDAVRLTVNGFHPPKYLPYGYGRAPRFLAQEVPIANLYNPKGHILICGSGRKSRALYGVGGAAWEVETVSRLRKECPGTRLVYRPKPSLRGELIPGCIDGSPGSIEDWLNGCSYAVMQHSNVQVDCLRYGIPFSCTDGILSGGVDITDKLATLEAVSWFNYRPEEVKEMLGFVGELSGGVQRQTDA